MATLETPPNPAPASAPPPDQNSEQQPLKVSAGKYGELEQHELVRLLDSFDDERSRGRFRESIYISIFVYLALAWLLFFGPRYLFHNAQLISVKDAKHDTITRLDMPKDLSQIAPKPRIVPKNPVLDKKAIDQLQAMRRAAEAARPAPLPPTPQPQPQQQPAPQQPPPPPQQQAQQPPPTPQPQPRPTPQPSTVPDAPKPNFAVNNNPGQNIRDAARNAVTSRGTSSGVGRGDSRPLGRDGAAAGTGAEILSDTLGVDFGPYLKRLLAIIKASWYPLIPEECYPPLSKEGTTLIRFSINSDGTLKIGGMHLDGSTHDQAIDRAAWGSITSVGQFPPLPADYKAPSLELRIQFVISRNPPPDSY